MPISITSCGNQGYTYIYFLAYKIHSSVVFHYMFFHIWKVDVSLGFERSLPNAVFWYFYSFQFLVVTSEMGMVTYLAYDENYIVIVESQEVTETKCLLFAVWPWPCYISPKPQFSLKRASSSYYYYINNSSY